MGDVSFDTINNDVTGSSNFSLRMVPEDQLSCLGVDSTGSDHIVVAVRVRPLSEAEVAEGKRSCCDVLNGNTVVIRKGADPSAYLRSQKVGYIGPKQHTYCAHYPTAQHCIRKRQYLCAICGACGVYMIPMLSVSRGFQHSPVAKKCMKATAL